MQQFKSKKYTVEMLSLKVLEKIYYKENMFNSLSYLFKA